MKAVVFEGYKTLPVFKEVARRSPAAPLGRVSPIRVVTRETTGGMAQTKSRFRQFTDEQWGRVEPLLPSDAGRQGHPFRDNRKVIQGIIYRYRTGIPWRDLPREEFGPWQRVWKRHAPYAEDDTWDRVLQTILADADAAGIINWNVSVDATIFRTHQHGTNTTRSSRSQGDRCRFTRAVNVSDRGGLPVGTVAFRRSAAHFCSGSRRAPHLQCSGAQRIRHNPDCEEAFCISSGPHLKSSYGWLS
ncbi:IS5 family transposase [Dietzia maris]|uniref:IS5 family transposase n=1 Tax=Dietzia maris TaxID=37915 RepID=UPI0037C8F04E